MDRQRKLFIAKTAVILSVVPVLIWAHSAGPDVGKSGVPGESTCNEAGCHVGTALNGGGGSVTVAFPNGSTYTPGVKQHLVVTIADPNATQRRWGFQLTARLAANSKTPAGTFTSTDRNTGVVCGATPTDLGEVFLDFGSSQACPAAKQLAYIEHTLTGSSRFQPGSQTYEFDWTPPSTDVGNIVIYVAGNAANNNGTETGDHIYTKSYTLTRAASGTAPAVIKVVSASGFGGFASIAPGTWIEISGSNLSATTETWDNYFKGVNAPTQVPATSGTSVQIGGKSAFVFYVSPTQVNALVPADVATGSQPLIVSSAGGPSAAFTVNVVALEPGLLALPQSPWLVNGKQYVVAQTCDPGKTCKVATDITFILPAGTSIPGYPVRPAKPGETLTIYGIGFGPAIDSSNTNVPVGQIVQVASQLTNQVQMQVNGVPATLSYAGMAPNLVGTYQFNLVVPAVPDGDWPLTITQNGVKSGQTMLLSVKN